MGTALARLLARAGYDFLGAASRTIESARKACGFAGFGEATTIAPELTRTAELVFITTPDDVIADVCKQIAEASGFARGTVVAHCSGALPSTVLEPARACGAHIGSMHPLQSFATAEQAIQTLPGSYCCIEGALEAVEVLSAAAQAIGARVMTIPTEGKTLYHAAAVVACNFLVALEHAALKVDKAAGIGGRDAMQSLLPLIKGTVSNLEKVGIPQCLTGPIARGDIGTTRRHLEAIEQKLPDLLPLYKVLGLETIEVALAKGTLSEAGAAELRRMLGP